jgi:ATP-dependent DNA helicase RecQ
MDDAVTTSSMRRTLRETFGIARLRPEQEEVIRRVLAGRDTLAVMPTGSGKSLCYQLPALHLPGTTVVVSPLISLMKDQADKLAAAGVDASQVNSTLGARAEEEALTEIEEARSDVVFATPERLADPEFLATLGANRVDLFVIDEAHCISQWGHDFRPAFLQLADAIRALGRPPVLALTATATDEVIADIRKQLDLPRLHVVNAGVFRRNLRYRVVQVTNDAEKQDNLLKLTAGDQGVVIVYCATVKAAEHAHARLREAGVDAALYHGRLGARERRQSQDAFMAGARRVMVATNAFGMGIDKPDVRGIVHYQMPGTLEAYYQESGRAGRDGEHAQCTLLFDARDRQVQQFFLARRYPEAAEIAAIHRALVGLDAAGAPVGFDALREALDGIAANKLEVGLKLLRDSSVVGQDRKRNVRLLAPDLGERDFEGLAQDYRKRGERDREKLERMVFYAQSALCRWKILLEYFGEAADWERCGTCDNCVEPPERRLAPIEPVVKAPATPREPAADPCLKTGEAVTLPRFGAGIVAGIAGDHVQVSFPDGATRTFMRRFVQRREPAPRAVE